MRWEDSPAASLGATTTAQGINPSDSMCFLKSESFERHGSNGLTGPDRAAGKTAFLRCSAVSCSRASKRSGGRREAPDTGPLRLRHFTNMRGRVRCTDTSKSTATRSRDQTTSERLRTSRRYFFQSRQNAGGTLGNGLAGTRWAKRRMSFHGSSSRQVSAKPRPYFPGIVIGLMPAADFAAPVQLSGCNSCRFYAFVALSNKAEKKKTHLHRSDGMSCKLIKRKRYCCLTMEVYSLESTGCKWKCGRYTIAILAMFSVS